MIKDEVGDEHESKLRVSDEVDSIEAKHESVAVPSLLHLAKSVLAHTVHNFLHFHEKSMDASEVHGHSDNHMSNCLYRTSVCF